MAFYININNEDWFETKSVLLNGTDVEVQGIATCTILPPPLREEAIRQLYDRGLQETLEQIALSDPSPEIRREAVLRITSQEVLDKVITEDEDDRVVEYAVIECDDPAFLFEQMPHASARIKTVIRERVDDLKSQPNFRIWVENAVRGRLSELRLNLSDNTVIDLVDHCIDDDLLRCGFIRNEVGRWERIDPLPFATQQGFNPDPTDLPEVQIEEAKCYLSDRFDTIDADDFLVRR